MLKSQYHISKMDCPSEENMIRMKLEGIHEIQKLDFDIANRTLWVYHTDDNTDIENRLQALQLGSRFVNVVEDDILDADDDKQQRKLLYAVLLINFAFFVIEMSTGLLSHSMGLVADSLDMLADSFVYGLSLWAVGATLLRKKRVALLSGYIQLTLAVLGVIEVIRRFVSDLPMPDVETMIWVSAFALLANGLCLYLLQKSKSNEAHMKASMIFTSNDVIINAGVILAAILVFVTQSKYPDLIIGTIVFVIVVRGALRILKLGK